MREIIGAILEGPKMAYAVAAGTAGAGMGTMFDFIPDDIGKLASMVGLLLSVLVFALQIRKHILEERRFRREEREYRSRWP